MIFKTVAIISEDQKEIERVTSLVHELDREVEVLIKPWRLAETPHTLDADVLLLLLPLPEVVDSVPAKLTAVSSQYPVIILSATANSYLAGEWATYGIQDYLDYSQLTPRDLGHSIEGAVSRFKFLHDQRLQSRRRNELVSERLVLATEAAQQGVWDWDMRHDRLEWGGQMFAICGVDKSSFQGKFEDWTKVIHPDDLLMHQEFLSKPLTDRTVFDSSYRIIRQGELRYVRGKGMVLLDEDKPKRMLGVIWDITDEVLTNRQLEQSEEKYRHLLDNLSEVVFQCSTDGKWMFLSNAWQKISGFDPEECINRSIADFLDPDDLQQNQQLLKDLSLGKINSCRYETKLFHKEGELRWVNVFANVASVEGKVSVIVGILKDITSRKRAEQDLRKTEQRFRAIFNSSYHFIGLMQPDGTLIEANETALRFAGISDLSQVSGKPFWETPWWNYCTTVQDKLKNAIQQAASGETVQYYAKVKGIGEKLSTINFSITPLYDTTGKVYMLIPEGRDMTEIVESLEREKELNRQKSQFVATASHQFRTPLTSMQTGIDIIKILTSRIEKEQQDVFRSYLQMIEGEIVKFRNLMTDILTIEAIENKKTPFKPAYYDLVNLCKEIIAIHFSHTGNDRKVLFEYVGEVQEVYFDKKLIEHIIINLLSNAIKFSNEDVTLRLSYTDLVVELVVQDKGIGISPEDISHLFESFYRAKNAINIQGTGLGLTIVKQFVELHEGTVKVKSTPGEGTEFIVVLPRTSSIPPVYNPAHHISK